MNYKVGDKIIINKNMILYVIENTRFGRVKEPIKRSQLNGMEATINSISALCIQVDINGRKANFDPQSFNPEIIEREYKQDYREDLLNVADDINGVLLKNINPSTELLQKGI